MTFQPLKNSISSASYVVRIKNTNVTVLSQSNRIRFDEHIDGLRAYFLDQVKKLINFCNK